MASERLAQDPLVVVLAAFKKNDAAVVGKGIENDGEAGSGVVRISAADARPGRFAAACGTFDGIGDEDGVVGHGKEKRDGAGTTGQAVFGKGEFSGGDSPMRKKKVRVPSRPALRVMLRARGWRSLGFIALPVLPKAIYGLSACGMPAGSMVGTYELPPAKPPLGPLCLHGPLSLSDGVPRPPYIGYPR